MPASRRPAWLRELLPERVHPASRDACELRAAGSNAARASHEAPAPAAPGPPDRDDPFARHAALRRLRRSARARLRAGRTPRDLARIHRALGNGAPSNEEYDALTVRVMDRVLERDSACVDVGCHRGELLSEILTRAPEGRHFAFEPLPQLFADLRGRFEGRSNVRIIEAALGDAPGRASFHHVVSNPGYSSLRRRRYDRPDEQVEAIEVEVLRLDDVLPAELPIRLIKIDVEGAELGVLRGGRRTLERHRPYVIFEHGLGASEYYGTGPADVYALLVDDCGLRINTLSRWLAGQPALECSELEELYCAGLEFYFIAYA